jgi:phosphotransferase system enzyme I (PtsP)
VVEVADSAGKPVSICGEMAADPMSALILMGMGITEFSLSSSSIPVVKQAVRRVTMAEARRTAATVLSMDTGGEIRSFLERTGKELGV